MSDKKEDAQNKGKDLSTQAENNEEPLDIPEELQQVILDAAPDFEEKTPEEQRMIIEIAEHFSGPLPHPAILEGYENVLPGAAERIMCLAEDEAKHRRKLQEMSLSSAVEYNRRGQNRGFIIGVAGIASGLAIILCSFLLGDGSAATAGIITGTLLSGSSIVTMVHKFIDGPKDSRESLTSGETSKSAPKTGKKGQ